MPAPGTGTRQETRQNLLTLLLPSWKDSPPPNTSGLKKKPAAFKAHLNSYNRSCHLIYQVTAVF